MFAYAKTKTQISFAVTAKLISAFVFTTRIVQSLYFLNPKFQASSHLLWPYSMVCVGPGRKPRRPFFSQRGSFWFPEQDTGSDCASSWSLLFFTLREHLNTHKVFTKDQCFYLNYHKFSIKSCVLDVY